MAPTDDLFRAVFRNQSMHGPSPASCRRIAAAIDWSTPELSPSSFLDGERALSLADLLFTACIAGKRVLLHLFGTSRRWTAGPRSSSRLYVVQICATGAVTIERGSPEVIPIVVHGPRRGGPTSIDELVERTASRAPHVAASRGSGRAASCSSTCPGCGGEIAALRRRRVVLFVLRVRMDAGFDNQSLTRALARTASSSTSGGSAIGSRPCCDLLLLQSKVTPAKFRSSR